MARIVLNNLPFDDAELSNTEANAALGRFMTVWSQIEVVCSFLFRSLSRLDADVSTIIREAVNTREQLNVIAGISEIMQDQAVGQRLVILTKDVRKLSEKRNKIVHSSWGTFNGEAARFYWGLTQAKLEEIVTETQRGKTYPGTFVFTITHLNELMRQGADLRRALEAVLDDLPHDASPAVHRMPRFPRTEEEIRAALLEKFGPQGPASRIPTRDP